MSKLVNVSVKVPEDVKEKMKKTKVNWSDYLRNTIIRKVEEEEAIRSSKVLDELRRSSRQLETKKIVAWLREDRGR